MSETAQEATTTANAPTPASLPLMKPPPAATSEAAPQAESEQFDAEYVARLRRENARYRTESKANADKAKQFDELQESQKTELQKATEAAAAAEARAQAAELSAMRLEVAAAKQLPAALRNRLAGATREEMEADAEAILADLAGAYVPKTSSTPAATGAGVTGDPAADYEAMSPTQMVDAIRKRHS